MMHCRTQARFKGSGRRGFTLIEVLATLLLVGIVLPTVMQGISLSGRAAAIARRSTEASGLAESKISELVATGQWQSGALNGDFLLEGWPDYRWEASVQTWGDGAVQELDLKVFWQSRGTEESLSLSTLVYEKATASQ